MRRFPLSRPTRGRMVARVSLLAWALLAAAGCGFDPLPKMRIGSAPYPRTNGYLDALDPAKLGPHRYDSFIPYLDAEKSRGIVYTCRGGFVDLSHARHVSDWTRFVAVRARRQLTRGRERFTVTGTDHSSIEFCVRYPDWWAGLDGGERRDLVDALALRLGQQAAYALQTYHEVQTWHGYRYVPFFAEWDSAFCYDDMVSHLVGVRTAAAALEGGRRLGMKRDDYNAVMERAYAAEMARLGGVPPKRTWAAIAAVRGSWWGESVPVRRQPDAGYDDGALDAWTIPGFECGHAECAAGDATPYAFEVPTLADVNGRDLRDMAHVYVRPAFFHRGRMARALGDGGGDARRLRIDRELPRLVANAAADARRRLGETAVSPPAGWKPPRQVLPADGGEPVDRPAPATRVSPSDR